MKKTLLFLVSLCSLAAFTSCCQKEQPKQAKYVFYFISDGTGVNTVQAAEIYFGELEGQLGRKPTCMASVPVVGVASTCSANSGVTDSAASGTALASGVKTYNGAIGVDMDTTNVYGIANWAKAAGKLVGIASSVCVNHATPGAQYAHRPSRNMYYEIGLDLAASGFDFFGGSDFAHAQGKDGQPSLYQVAQDSGYVIARGVEDFNAKKDSSDKLIFFQKQEQSDVDEFSLPYWIDHKDGMVASPDVLQAELDFLLAKGGLEKGFFIMNEIGGKVDFACHSNDAATAFQEVATTDSAFQIAYNFYLQHPDETLIVLTADHETGGLTVGRQEGGYTLNLKLLKNQKCSDAAFTRILQNLRAETHNKVTWEQVKAALTENFGFFDAVEVTEEEESALKDLYTKSFVGKMENDKNLYTENEPMTSAAIRLMSKKAYIGWTTGGHTAGLVPVYACGVGAEKFACHNDNAEIPLKIAEIAGYTVKQR